MKLYYLIAIILLISSCNENDNVEIEYHPNGEIASKVPTVDGIKNGKKNLYYPTGKYKGYTNYIDGKKNGEAMFFWENGNIWQRFIYEDDLIKDSSIIYRKTGVLNEIHYFDSLGRYFDYKRYTTEGKIDLSHKSRNPLFLPFNKSSFKKDEDPCIAQVRLGNRQGYRIEAVLGSYEKNNSIIYSKDNWLSKVDSITVKIPLNCDSVGQNNIEGAVIEVFENPLKIIVYPFEYTYYVK
ncbi:MAG: hypothetical protein WBB45_03845 [Cyclobacteriaceae bacterium]